MSKTQTVDDITSGDHVAVYYGDEAEAWNMLADYFRTGFERNELCVFVTQHGVKRAVKELDEAGLDIRRELLTGKMRIFDMVDTYLADGRFVAEFMLHNVMSFIDDAEALGYNGLRTAGDMEWIKDHPEFGIEADIYEKDVNKLMADSPKFTGLCLYAVKKDRQNIIHDSIDSHPALFYKGTLFKQPYELNSGILRSLASVEA